MLKQDVINEIQAKIEGTTKKQCGEFLAAFESVIYEALGRGEEVKITGFGTYKTRKLAAREGTNPQTKEKMKIPESIIPAFKAGKTFKDAVKA